MTRTRLAKRRLTVSWRRNIRMHRIVGKLVFRNSAPELKEPGNRRIYSDVIIDTATAAQGDETVASGQCRNPGWRPFPDN